MLEDRRGERWQSAGPFDLSLYSYTCCLDLDTSFLFIGICDYHLKVFWLLSLTSLHFCENYYHKSDYVVLMLELFTNLSFQRPFC